MADQQIFFEVQRSLAGVDYPATRDVLVDAASEAGAADDVIAMLRTLPEGTFSDPTQVTEALAR